jgi:hypothetical protein
MWRLAARILLTLLAILTMPGMASAKVVRLVIEERTPFAGGAEWGKTGPYERIVGVAHLDVDPADPLNAGIVDLDLAPRNARGRVEFRTRFFMLKPKDMGRSNGKIYYTANNRGNDALLNAQTVQQVGRNDFALMQGYTILDAGWQGDLVEVPTRLDARLPIAVQRDGSPIVGMTRVEFSDRNIPAAGIYTLPLKGNAAFRSYPAASLDTTLATFTVRDQVGGRRAAIPSDRWAFGRCLSGRDSLAASPADICLFDGFRVDKIYELVYPARDPIVMGLGYATTRDVASFFRYEAADAQGLPNPLREGGAAPIRRIYATGASQTGSYLRDFLYLGFNEDEGHRRVFDGVIPTIAGALRVFINVRFADPNVYSSQDDRHDFLQSSQPPFTYEVTADPISGVRDGILKRPSTDPFVLHADSSTEFWQLHASLNVADASGRPVPVPPNVRLYLSSSTSHGFGIGGLLAPSPGKNPQCAHPTPGAVNDLARALLTVMDQWVDGGIEPPPSQYPAVDDGTLVRVDDARKAFPAIPGVTFPPAANAPDLLDFGVTFGRFGGVIAHHPPRATASYPVLVPKPDADGHDVAGIRAVQVRAPLGTTTGWNVRAPGRRAPNLCGLSGAYLPFPATRAARTSSGDSRKSLEERYRDHEGFVRAVESATRALVRARFLLPEDAERYVTAAKDSDVLK